MRVGVVGLGLLGSALAERLMRAGFEVVGYDLDETCRRRLAEAGGQPLGSLDEVPRQATRLVLALPDSRAVASVVGDWRERLSSGTVIIDSSTGDPADAEARAAELAPRGVDYVDATVVGSSQQTRDGLAVMLVGGRAESIESVRPLLATCSSKFFIVGPAGAGSRLKLIVNLVLGLNRAVLAEGLHLARACGCDLASTLEVLQATPAASAVMATKGPKMIAEDFEPQARLAQHHKDVKLILELAARANVSLPLSEVHETLLQTAVDRGYGRLDNSAILRAWPRT